MVTKKILLLLLVLLASITQANAATSYSKLLQTIQQKYLKKGAAPYPTLIMDRDEIEWRFISQGATKSSKKRERIIKQYVLENTGVKISDDAAANFEPYLSTANNSAIAMAATAPSSTEPLMCAIFPPAPNGNQRLEMERLLQLNTREVYGTKGFDQLKETMSYDDLILFSLLHESGHCLDQTFFTAINRGENDPHTIHLSESFAETVAVLLAAKENHPNLAKPRASLRSTYTYYMEPFFAHHPENGLGNESYLYAGLMYFLAPSIIAAGKEVESDPARINAMPLAEILALAKNIVEKNALEQKLFTAIYYSYSEGREATLASYQAYAQNSPDLFANTLIGLKLYIEQEDRLKETFFDENKKSPSNPENDLLAINYSELCSSLKKKNMISFQNEIQTLRENIEQSGAAVTDQRSRSAELMNLWKNLPEKCGLRSR